MLLSEFNDKGYFFNKNLSGNLGDAEIYRGDLVLELGEVTERGDRLPPKIVAKQGVLFMTAGKIDMLIAGIDKLADLTMLSEKYASYYADNVQLLVFVHDLGSAAVVSYEGNEYIAEPLDDGMIFNEALELLCIEKSDLKGQSAEEKVETVLAELKDFKPKGAKVSYEDALGMTIEVKASARGPV